MTKFLVWIRDHKSSAAGVLLVVAGCLALMMLSRKVHHLSPRKAPATTATAPASGATGTGTANGLTPSETAGTEQSARTAKMRTEFETAPSYLEFIGRAIGRPQEGGKFYAMLAWKRCNDLTQHKGVAPTHTGSDAFHDGALALVQDIEKRCTGVLETYPDIVALYKIAVEQRGGRDFLMPADGRGIVTPTSRQNAQRGHRRGTAARATAGPRPRRCRTTPTSWTSAIPRATTASTASCTNGAAEIVACELVSSCRGGVEVSLHCVGTGDCVHDDYRDVVLGKVPESHRMVYDTMLSGMRARGPDAGRADADANAS